MKKWTLLVLALFLAFGQIDAQNNGKEKMKIAVMDFKAGVGVNESEVEGLSDMLINTLFETKKFDIVERSQLNQVIKEQKFQNSELTNAQLAKVGRILGVEAILIGTVNFLAEHKNTDGSLKGEYNVDVRAVDVETAMIVTTAGATKSSNSTYRSMMEKIGKQLATNLLEDESETIVEESKPEKDHFRKSGFTLIPQLGLCYGLRSYNDNKQKQGMIGPSADIAIGYQLGCHFFFGGVIGYEGYYINQYHHSNGDVDHNGKPVFAIMADVRWYPIDHEKSFIVDLQGGFNSRGSGIAKLSGGFAKKNYEGLIGVGIDVDGKTYYFINFGLRFGQVVKKWW